MLNWEDMGGSIDAFIAAGEGERIEFHGARTRLKTLGKSICGMLNHRGGTILYGVDDRGQPGSVVDAATQIDALYQFLDAHLIPATAVSAVPQVAGGETVVVIVVPEGQQKPYALMSEVFVRINAQTVRQGELDR